MTDVTGHARSGICLDRAAPAGDAAAVCHRSVTSNFAVLSKPVLPADDRTS